MCGRFALFQTRADLRELFELEIAEELDLAPRYNVAPSQFVPVVRNAGTSRTMTEMRWGFEPHWSDGSGPKPINARGETVARSPSFRESFATRRCLVPLSGYYEWQAVGSKKQPYFFRPPVACAFAGIWDQSGVDGAATFAIVTTLAVPSLTQFHERMPVLLGRDQFASWLDPRTHKQELLGWIEPFEWNLESWPVSTAVNSPRSQGKKLLDRVEPLRLPPTLF